MMITITLTTMPAIDRPMEALPSLLAPAGSDTAVLFATTTHTHHTRWCCTSFLANVNSRLRSLCCRLSVWRLSVTLVRPTQTVQIFGNVYTPFGTLDTDWHSRRILRRSSQGNPSVGGLNARGVAKYSDFGPIEGYISETVQDKR